MPSLALTVSGAALLLAVATNAAGQVDNNPTRLRVGRSNLRKRVPLPQTSPNLLATASLPPPRQDSIYVSPDFNSEATTQRINQQLETNAAAATEAIALGKNDPNVIEDVSIVKRAKPGPKWRWDFDGTTPIRGVNLGGWLVTEVSRLNRSSSLLSLLESTWLTRFDSFISVALDHSFPLRQHR